MRGPGETAVESKNEGQSKADGTKACTYIIEM